MQPIDPNQVKTLTVALATHEGETGKNNEDTGDFAAYRISQQDPAELYLGIVADGIGGHQAGERASRLAVDVVKHYFRQATSRDILRYLKEAFIQANAQVVKEGRDDPKLRGMGTTMTAAVVLDGKLYVGHVGDSRAYIVRNGQLIQISVDHTWAQEAIEAKRLTPEQARQHPNRNVIKRYMGIQSDMEVDFRLRDPDNPAATPTDKNQGMTLRPGDTILLCSDGLSDMVPDPDIHTIMLQYAPKTAAVQLVNLARRNGGYDNITVVILQVPGGNKAAAVAPRPAGAGRRIAPILAGVLVLALLAAGAVWAFTAGPLKTQATPTPLPTAAVPTATEEMVIEEQGTSAPSPTSTLPPTATPRASETPTAASTEEESGVATPTPLPTFTPTNTPLPPTRTPTWTPSATPSETPVAGDTGGNGSGPKPPDPPSER